MSVRHSGLIGGSGDFTLSDGPGAATTITWRERLRFPWWMGATMLGGAFPATPETVLHGHRACAFESGLASLTVGQVSVWVDAESTDRR